MIFDRGPVKDDLNESKNKVKLNGIYIDNREGRLIY